MKVSTEIDNNFGYKKITQLADNIPLNEVETSHHLISIRLYFFFDDFNYVRQTYYFLTIATQFFFSITYNKMKKYILHCQNSSSIQ
jgi:hypothetical protein